MYIYVHIHFICIQAGDEHVMMNWMENYKEALTSAPASVCCRVLQRVAACCSVLQCVAACCSVLQCVVLLQRVAA